MPAHLVLGLGLWGLKGAGQDGKRYVLELLGHLRVREVLVDDDALNQSRVFHGPSDLALHLRCNTGQSQI